MEDRKESKWIEVIINEKNYEINKTVPNSQYSLQIGISDNEKNNIQQDNMVYLYTQSTCKMLFNSSKYLCLIQNLAYVNIFFLLDPKAKPELINNETIFVTKNSVQFELNDASKNCEELNGFFLNYYIELKVYFIISTILSI